MHAGTSSASCNGTIESSAARGIVSQRATLIDEPKLARTRGLLGLYLARLSGSKSWLACKWSMILVMDPRVRAVMSVMLRETAGRLSIEILSRDVNLSCNRLRQLFVKEIGVSPTQYLRYLRLFRAARMLRSTFLSVKEVAFLSGARDISHFVRDFKKQFGLTPSAYRDQAQNLEKASCPVTVE